VLAGVLTPEQARSQAGLFQLARTGHALLETLEGLTRRHQLTPGQFRLLMVLRFLFPDGAQMSEVADVLEIRAPSLTELVNASPELFMRSPSRFDRREVLLSARPEGVSRLEATLPKVAALAHRLNQRLGEHDWDQLTSLVADLDAALRKDDQ